MAHFAQIVDNIVTRVLVVPDFAENRAEEFLSKDLGLGGTWIKTSFTGKIRKNFAGKGYSYNPSLDAFIPPKPYDSWILDEDICKWMPPVPLPDDGNLYYWDEENKNWVRLTN